MERMLRQSDLDVSVGEALEAIGQVKAVRVEVNGEAFLARTDLPPLAGKALAALGIRPPPKVLPLN